MDAHIICEVGFRVHSCCLVCQVTLGCCGLIRAMFVAGMFCLVVEGTCLLGVVLMSLKSIISMPGGFLPWIGKG